MGRIANAAPMVNLLGTEDLSTRQVTAVAEELPQHLPKVYIYAKKGPTTPQLVVGASRTLMYGADSFDYRKKFANHATVLSNFINAQANAQMIERVKPADAAPPASIRLCIDLLATQVPEYERDTDGSIKKDSAGVNIKTGVMIPGGFVGKWVVEEVNTDADGNSDFGIAEKKIGDQIDAATTTQSVRIPILDTVAPYFGEDGNHNGIRIWAPTTDSNISIDPTILEDATTAAYPLRMACVYRETDVSTPKFTPTMSAEQYVDVCFKQGVLNTRVEKQAYIGDVFIQAYQDLQSQTASPTYGPFGAVHVYDEFVAELLAQLYAAEVPFIDVNNSDFKNIADEEYRFNFISGMSSAGVPYHSFILNTTDNNSVRLTENTTIYARGGSDGTMNNEAFGVLVADAVKEYASPLSVLQDTAKFPESIIYDSGFPLTTKYALCDFIALRKDTAVVLATHTAGKPKLTASEDSALAVALRTRIQMYPESDYYGTPVMRGMIVGRSGTLINSQYTERLPLTIEIAHKAAKYCGAGNGMWKSGKNFDHAPASNVELFTDINVEFTPAVVRNKDWAAGLNWVQSFTRRGLFFPALKTVYDDDTSVLNSFFTMMACCELQKVGERAWRQYSGVSSLTNAQLIKEVNDFVVANTNGRFDDRFVIIPETYFTDADLQRGYSWALRIKLYAPNMKTVMTMSVQANRIDDLAA